MAIQGSFPNEFPSLLLDFANTKKLDPRITFTRASTATYYDGVTTAKAEENLLIHSQAFDNIVWQKNTTTVTANTTTAPDGTTTGSTLVGSTSTSRIIQYIADATANKTFTFSVYLKAASNLTARIGIGSESVREILTQNVSVTTSWQRFTITVTGLVTDTGRTQVSIYCSDGTTGVSVDAWGAQLEQRSSVTAYTPTTTQPITNYIPVLRTAQAGQARFDHNPTTDESLGLLIEEQRTNLFTYSGSVGGTNWTPVNIISTLNTAIAPDGTLTASNIISNTVNANHSVLQTGSALTAGAYTASCYIKAYTARYITVSLYFDGNANRYSVVFDALNGVFVSTTGVQGTATSGSYNITPVGNGWYKATVTATTPTMTIGPGIRMFNPGNVPNNETASFAGDGYSGVLVWGAQVEAGAFATSYIPTVASQITRAADTATMTGTNFSSWFNQSEGALYGETLTSATGDKRIACISGGGVGNRLLDLYYNSPNTAIVAFKTADVSINTSGTYNGVTTKVAAVYKENDYAIVANAGTVVTDTTANLSNVIPSTTFGIGNIIGGGFTNGTIKKIAYYPYRLTNAELQAITS